jgi:hypothetical protein
MFLIGLAFDCLQQLLEECRHKLAMVVEVDAGS